MFKTFAKIGPIWAGGAVFGMAVLLTGGGQPLARSAETAPAAPVAAPVGEAEKIAQGKEVFATAACEACHTLADAGASSTVGPSLDGDGNLTPALIVSRITNGQGAMPGFGGRLNTDEIDAVAAYVMHAAKKPG